MSQLNKNISTDLLVEWMRQRLAATAMCLEDRVGFTLAADRLMALYMGSGDVSERVIIGREREAFCAGVWAEKPGPQNEGWLNTQLNRRYPLTSPPKEILKFKGKPLEDCSRDELLEAIHYTLDNPLGVWRTAPVRETPR